jgi:hypothetical protein
MPTPTYTPLANVTLGTAVSSVTFGSIPATYRDLIIVLVGSSSTLTNVTLRINGDSGSNYSFQRMTATTSGFDGNSGTGTSGTLAFSGVVSTSATQFNLNIMDYSATNKHKTTISRTDNSARGTEAYANRWANTAAVTSVSISTASGNWAIGTTAAIYGIVA